MTLANRSRRTRWNGLALGFCLLTIGRAALAAGGDSPPIQAPTLVIINSAPAGASFTLDGAPPDHTPATLLNIAPGKHHVVATLENYAPAEQDFEVKEHETTSVRLLLERLQGTLALTSTETVSCMVGEIRIDVAAGEVPMLRVPAGTVSVECKSDRVLPINQEVRISAGQTARLELKPTRVQTSNLIRVESPDSQRWELRSGTGALLCNWLPCTVEWAGRGMKLQVYSELDADLRRGAPETKALPDELPYLPPAGTAIRAAWVPERGSLTGSIVGLSISALLIGGAVPLCVVTANSDSGTNVGAGVGCIATGVLGGVGAIFSVIGLATWAPGRWDFTTVAEKAGGDGQKEDARWSFALTRAGASLSF